MRRLLDSYLLGCLLLSGAAAAQQAPEAGTQAGTVDADRLIESRDRGLSHPGDPLDIVGLFERDNNLMSNKGALKRSTYKPKLIDKDEAYERQLAMFEKRETYSYAYAPAFNGDGEMPTIEPQVRRPAPEPESGSSTDAWIAALTVAAFASLALMAQSRK
jgi:Skp family chaperone for outer membrane proteins